MVIEFIAELCNVMHDCCCGLFKKRFIDCCAFHFGESDWFTNPDFHPVTAPEVGPDAVHW